MMLLPQSNKFWIALLFAFCCVIVLSHPARAQAIPVANNSFEDQVVSDGSYSTGIPGWSLFNGYPYGSSVEATVNPGGPNSGEAWPSSTPAGMDGSNFGQLFVYSDYGGVYGQQGGGGVLYQDTGVQYQAGVTYVLTVDFGLQINQTFGSNAFVELGNSQFVAFGYDYVSPSDLTPGAFTSLSISYTATGSEDPGNGAFGTAGDIFIAFSLYESPSQSYLDIDNVRLTAVPEPGSIAIAAWSGLAVFALVRRKGYTMQADRMKMSQQKIQVEF